MSSGWSRKMNMSAWKIMTGTVALLVGLLMLGGCDRRYIKEDLDTAQAADKLHTNGLMLFDEGRYNEALDAWTREIILDPKRPKPYNNVGIVYRKLGQLQSAMQYHKKAITADPQFGHSYYSLGLVHFDMQDYRAAVNMFLKAIENKYENADVFYSLGQSYNNLKEFSRALEAYENAARRYFTYPGVHYQIGVIHALQGNVDLARMELKRELSFNTGYRISIMIKLLEIDAEQSPQDTDALFKLGNLYADMSDDQKAVDMLKRVLAINPAYPDAHLQLGMIYFRQGNLDGAEDEYRKEIEVNPGNEYARRALDALHNQSIKNKDEKL